MSNDNGDSDRVAKFSMEMDVETFNENISLIQSNLEAFRVQSNEVSFQPEVALEDSDDSIKNLKLEIKKPKRKLEDEIRLNREYHTKQIEFTQHEFVKMNEVGYLIQEAIQGVLDKMHLKERVTQANKAAIRKQDQKLQIMEQQVGCLLNLTNTVRDLFKKTKDLKTEIVDNHHLLIDETQKNYLKFQDINGKIGQLQNNQRQMDFQIEEVRARLSDMKELNQKQEERLMSRLHENQKELTTSLDNQGESIKELETQYQQMVANYNKLSTDVIQLTMKEQEKIVQSLKEDSQRLTNLEFKVRDMLPLKRQYAILDDSVKQLTIDRNENRESQVFLERIMPLVVHLQIQEGLTLLIHTEQQKTALEKFDRAKLLALTGYIQESEGYPVRLSVLRKRVLALTNYLIEQNRGSVAITYGKDKDYWAELPEKNQPIINKVNEFLDYTQMTSRNISQASEQVDKRIKSILALTPSQPTLQSEINLNSPKSPQPQVQKPQQIIVEEEMKVQKNIAKPNKFKINKEPVAQQPQIIQIKYIQSYEVQTKLDQLERKQKLFFKFIHRQFNQIAELYEERLIDSEESITDLKQRLFQSFELIKVLQTGILTPNPDRILLQKKLNKIESQLAEVTNLTLKSRVSEQSPLIKMISRKMVSNISRQSSVQTPPPDEVRIQSNQDSDQIKAVLDSQTQKFLQGIETSNLKIEQAQNQFSQTSQQLSDQIEKNQQHSTELIQRKLVETREELIAICSKNNTEIKEIQFQIENKCDSNSALVSKSWQMTEELQTQFKSDYNEFIRDRKRWKLDFEQATQRANSRIILMEEMVKNCLSQQGANIVAIKMLLDALMIGQLCEKQDIEDKKQIGIFGMRSNTQLLNPYLATDQLDSQNQQCINKDHQVLRVDKSCLQCSGNMSQVLQQIKLACLSYTQSPITYKEKKYAVDDLLRIKGNIISDCQKIIRENIYQREPSFQYQGVGDNVHNDERSYIIEPMLDVVSLDKQQFIYDENMVQSSESTRLQSKLRLDSADERVITQPIVRSRKVRVNSMVHIASQRSETNCGSPRIPEPDQSGASSQFFQAFSPQQNKFAGNGKRRNLNQLKQTQMLNSRAINKSTEYIKVSQQNKIVQTPLTASGDMKILFAGDMRVNAILSNAQNQAKNTRNHNKQRTFSSAAIVSQYAHPNLQTDQDFCQINEGFSAQSFNVEPIQIQTQKKLHKF